MLYQTGIYWNACLMQLLIRCSHHSCSTLLRAFLQKVLFFELWTLTFSSLFPLTGRQPPCHLGPQPPSDNNSPSLWEDELCCQQNQNHHWSLSTIRQLYHENDLYHEDYLHHENKTWLPLCLIAAMRAFTTDKGWLWDQSRTWLFVMVMVMVAESMTVIMMMMMAMMTTKQQKEVYTRCDQRRTWLLS